MSEKYQVGRLNDVQEDDPLFDTEDEALEYAAEKSSVAFDPCYGVWLLWTDTNHADLLYIIYEGEWFIK